MPDELKTVLRSDDAKPKPTRCVCGHTEGNHQPRFRYPASVGCRTCYCQAYQPRGEKA